MGIRDRRHGGMQSRELADLGLDEDGVIDFSVNCNPYGPSPAVRRAVRECRWDRYPDPQGAPLKQAIARRTDTDPERIIVGNGAAALMWELAAVLGKQSRKVLFVEPVFSEFRTACLARGVTVCEYRAPEAFGFLPDLAELRRRLQEEQPDLVYFCQPNSPTGVRTDADDLEALIREFPRSTFLLDFAFLSLSPYGQDAEQLRLPGVLRLFSFTKDHSMAGLRAGWLDAPPELVRAMEGERPCWSINTVAMAAAIAALDDDGFVEESRRRIFADRRYLRGALKRLGWVPLDSVTPYFMMRVGDGSLFRRRLLRRGVLVRDCASYGLPAWIRLCALPAEQADRLIQLLREDSHLQPGETP